MIAFPVALAASLGGIKAVGGVLAPPTADFPASVLLVRHRGEGAPFLLAEVLGRHARPPVRAARAGGHRRGADGAGA